MTILVSLEDVIKILDDYKNNNFENPKEYPINYGTILDFLRAIRKLPIVDIDEMIKEIKIKMWNWRGKQSISIDKIAMEKILNEVIHKYIDKEAT